MKYPEFREAFKHGTWFGGHIVLQDGLYYKLVKTDDGKVLKSFSYDELTDYDRNKISEELEKKEESFKNLDLFIHEIQPARIRLIEYVKKNGRLVSRSNQSESEYYNIEYVDGITYNVRISGHKYPTGSMTCLMYHQIDTTDYDCRPYCKLFGI